MGEEMLFEICYEGDLTVEVCEAFRRIGAEPNFDQSWRVALDGEHSPAVLTRWLRMRIGGDARLLVARAHHVRNRDLLLVRHSQTAGADYRELHGALERLGEVVDLPFESTFVIEPFSADSVDVHLIGEALAELCPDESLMVMGIAGDYAFCTGELGLAQAAALEIQRARAAG